MKPNETIDQMIERIAAPTKAVQIVNAALNAALTTRHDKALREIAARNDASIEFGGMTGAAMVLCWPLTREAQKKRAANELLSIRTSRRHARIHNAAGLSRQRIAEKLERAAQQRAFAAKNKMSVNDYR